MKAVRRVFEVLVDVVEVYVPVAAFFTLFVAFCLQVFFRYVLRSPLMWTFELTLVCFIWAVMLGACYCLRDNEHIVFSLVYDKMSSRAKSLTTIASNLMLIVLFSIAVVPVANYIFSLSDDFTSVLRISFTVAFFPFLVMVCDTIVRLVWNSAREIRSLCGGRAERMGAAPAGRKGGGA